MLLDHYVRLGPSGLSVSPLCLGGMTFGEDLGWSASVETSGAMIDGYLELGGHFIDAADGYTKGDSAKVIGDHLAHDRAKRDRVVLATKFSANLYPGDPSGGGSGRNTVMAACEQSLRRFQTDYNDPHLPFPLEFLRLAPAMRQAGTTVNGEPSELFPYSPRDQNDHY